MPELNGIGADWLIDEAAAVVDSVVHVLPSNFNEEHRYLPASVTSIPGYIRYAVNPYMREIVDCFDIDSPVREVSVMKGVQITYSTLLESGVLYYAAHIGTLPMMYVTADKELAQARIENNFLPMFQQSGFGHIIRSSDEGNTRKTGKTKNHLQFDKGAFLIPYGANNADKMRMWSICIMLKDEVDAWPLVVGKDGDPDALTDARTDGYTERAKIFRGSTPLIKSSSVIYRNYLRGDQRKYRIRCRACGFPQELRWSSRDKKTGVIGGFVWELSDGVLDTESVRYCCQNCGHGHHEHDKEFLYSPDNGAAWEPTAKPVERNIRSYHLPALYSPVGMRPWWKNVLQYLDCFDPTTNKVTDIPRYQVFYNNVLAWPFEPMGSRVTFVSVSAHRRSAYRMGEIPNEYAAEHSGSKILYLQCMVDVQKEDLAVAVFGIVRDAKPYLITYERYETAAADDDCSELTSPVWGRLRELIEETTFTADDGRVYPVSFTFIDAGYANDTVTTFCADYSSGVFPILGRDRPAKNQAIKEFAQFETQSGTVGYRILVDHYKDRMAPVLRREWVEGAGEQRVYHFNAPVDVSDKQLKELTVETRREKIDDKGNKVYYWHRRGGAKNELWDLLGYSYAGTEVMAWNICVQYFELDTIDWPRFWDYVESEGVALQYYAEPVE